MIKKIIKNIINRSGYTVYKNTENPHDAFVRQKNLYNELQPLIIFDVGANYGQTVIKYKTLFPHSKVYAFEPHPEAYVHLNEQARKVENVQTYNLAVGNYNGTADFHLNTYSETSSLLSNTQLGKDIWGEAAMTPAGTIKVEVCSLDKFIKDNIIPSIDILKLDTQGTEYQIIEGASESLAQSKIKMIYTEIITSHSYNNQKEIYEFMTLLYMHSFQLYGFYDYHYSGKKLTYVNAIFFNEKF
jgi:FkbM family methyltransferase